MFFFENPEMQLAIAQLILSLITWVDKKVK